jgi:hypothetical protein
MLHGRATVEIVPPVADTVPGDSFPVYKPNARDVSSGPSYSARKALSMDSPKLANDRLGDPYLDVMVTEDDSKAIPDSLSARAL